MSRIPHSYRIQRIGLCLAGLGGISLMFGSVVSLGTLGSDQWCVRNEISCYGSYSPSWLGLSNDPNAPQLGDWASGQGVVLVLLGFLLVASVAGLAWRTRTTTSPVRRSAILVFATVVAMGLYLAPLALGRAPASTSYGSFTVVLLFGLAVQWGRVVLSRVPIEVLGASVAGLAVGVVVATFVIWHSFHDFLSTWVAPHASGWQTFAYAWTAYLVPAGCVLATIGVLSLLASTVSAAGVEARAGPSSLSTAKVGMD